MQQTDIKEQLREIKDRITEHDIQLSQIYDRIENLLDENAATRKWEARVLKNRTNNCESCAKYGVLY